MILSETTTSNFEPPQAGTFTARLIALIDLGMQASTYEGETKSARKLLLKFEILDEENRRSDGTPHTVSKRFTASLHERAALRKFLESWRGRPFTAEELRAFDMKNLLGQPCLLGIVHTEKDGRTFANLSTCMKLPKGMPVPSGTEPLVYWSMSDSAPDWTAYAAMHRKLQEQIEASPEFARLTPPKSVQMGQQAPAAPAPARSPAPVPAAPVAPPAAAGAGHGFEDMDSDIPF